MMSSMTTPMGQSLAQSTVVQPKFTELLVNTGFELKKRCCFSRATSAQKKKKKCKSNSHIKQACSSSTARRANI